MFWLEVEAEADDGAAAGGCAGLAEAEDSFASALRALGAAAVAVDVVAPFLPPSFATPLLLLLVVAVPQGGHTNSSSTSLNMHRQPHAAGQWPAKSSASARPAFTVSIQFWMHS